MDPVLTTFFEDALKDFHRGSLHARMRRRQLCEYLASMIRNCSSVDGCDPETTCDKAVQAALYFHSRSRSENGGVCLMGKYHNVLYIVARLAFIFRLGSVPTVVHLLEAIFLCEGTFERIVSGAIFGPRLCGAISGWKSEFDSREECVEALGYFLRAASRGRAVFELADGRALRMADVPLVMVSQTVPATLALQVRRPDVFRLLVEYGAELDYVPEGMQSPLVVLSEMREMMPRDERVAECLSLGMQLHTRNNRWPFPSLKHLARIAVRRCLAENFQLPEGTCLLPLPLTLISYLRLETD